MRKTVGLIVGAMLVASSMPAFAAPDNDNKATNAAVPSSGTLCIVRGSEDDAYVVDPECKYHRVDKVNKDGSGFTRYQDKGTLQPGNIVPDKTVRIEIGDIYGDGCTGSEVITPSGNYSSDLTCTF